MNSNNKMKDHNVAHTSMNSKYSIHSERKDFRIVEVQCIYNTQTHDGNLNLITVRSHLGEKMRPGDVYYGIYFTLFRI
jgi:hypothetical protein